MHGNRVPSCLLVLLSVAALAPAALAAEKIDDPGYTYWSKFKPGAFAVIQTETDVSGQKMVMRMTTTLRDVTPEAITVDVTTETTSGATKMAPRTSKRVVPAKRDKPADSVIGESREDVTVGDKKYACRLMTETRQTMHIKTWMCEKVPGGLVKMEMTDDAMAMTSHLVDSADKAR